MYVIRRAKVDDQSTLLKLAKMVHFINLPADKEIIGQKIDASRRSFRRVARDEAPLIGERFEDQGSGLSDSILHTDLYMFVLDDESNPGCHGTSQLIAQMGGEHDPNLCFKLERREKYSESLKTGTSNVVARLHRDGSGPTEIGGLILPLTLRGHPAKLGRFLSLVRFHFLGRFRERFRDKVLAEMMAPITPDGENLLWDFLGRRFIPLSYNEADRFCQYSREFISSLMPSGDIHLSLLPPEARAIVGKVGAETVPARKMLERLGFEYHDLVDPFDGGPYLSAKTDEISIVKTTKAGVAGEPGAPEADGFRAIVSSLDRDGAFRAIQEVISVDAGDAVRISRAGLDALHAEPGGEIGYTPLPAGKKGSKGDRGAGNATDQTTGTAGAT